jgi:hypothetical protein
MGYSPAFVPGPAAFSLGAYPSHFQQNNKYAFNMHQIGIELSSTQFLEIIILVCNKLLF